MNVVESIEQSHRVALPLTVSDYRILDRAGAFDERPKVELIEGVLLTVSPQLRWHLRVKSQLGRRLGNKLQDLGYPLMADVDGTVVLSNESAAEPDIVISSDGPADDYVSAETVVLIVEVSDATLRYDLGPKKRLYARTGIPEYWVVSKQVIHRFWDPSGDGYRQGDERPFGETVESITLAGLNVESGGII